MRIPRQIVVAAMTVATVTTVGHAMLPSSQDHANPVKAEQEQVREYSTYRRRQLEEGNLRERHLVEALERDKLRSAEVRPAEKAARDVVRALVRRP
jgi:cell division protein FtsL